MVPMVHFDFFVIFHISLALGEISLSPCVGGPNKCNLDPTTSFSLSALSCGPGLAPKTFYTRYIMFAYLFFISDVLCTSATWPQHGLPPASL